MHRLKVRRNLVVYLEMGCYPNCEGAEALSSDCLIPTRQIFDFVLSPCSFGEIVPNGAKCEGDVAEFFDYLIPTVQIFCHPRSVVGRL